MDFVYIRRKKDGVVIDIPRRDLEITMKTGKFDLVQSSLMGNVPAPVYETPKIVANPLRCILCGFEAKTDKGLVVHKSKLHT